MQDSIANILLREFASVYCDTCSHDNADEWACEECHRKAMMWELHPEDAYRIAAEIVELFED